MHQRCVSYQARFNSKLVDISYGGYEVIRSIVAIPEEHQCLSVQIEIEHARLRDFGKVAGLAGATQASHLSPVLLAREQLLLWILSQIRQLLDDMGCDNNFGQGLDIEAQESRPLSSG